jgi:hypothetical protein
MNKLIVIRFGTPELIKSECRVIEEYSADLGKTFTFPFPPIGMVHIFETQLSSHQLVQRFQESAIESKTFLPVLVLPLETLEAQVEIEGHPLFESLQVFFEVAKKDLLGEKATKKPEIEKCELSLDQLLDLVNQKGVKGLTETERVQLQKLSENL